VDISNIAEYVLSLMKIFSTFYAIALIAVIVAT